MTANCVNDIMKTFFILIALLSAVPALIAADWLEPEAQYRLRVKPFDPADVSFVDLRRVVLPELPDNSVRVYDAKDNEMAFKLYNDYFLFISDSPDTGYFDIYFGFPDARSKENWRGKDPEAKRLRLLFYKNKAPTTLAEATEQRIADINRSAVWQDRSYRTRMYAVLMAPAVREEIISGFNMRNYLYDRRRNQLNLYHRDRNMRNNANNFFARPARLNLDYFNFKYLADWHAKYVVGELKRRQTQLDNADKAPEKWLRDDLNNLGRRRWNMVRPDASEVQLIERPPETSEFFTGIFEGQLYTGAAGTYEFRIDTNSLTILEIDGNEVFCRWNQDNKPVSETVKLELTPGYHKFKSTYRVNRDKGNFAIYWKQPGESSFAMLNSENFASYPEAKPQALVNRDGGKYPLITKRSYYILFTGKRERSDLQQFSFVDPAIDAVTYRTERESGKPALNQNFILPHQKGAIVFEAPGFLPLPDSYYYASGDGMAVNPDLHLKLWLGDFIYDNEVLPFEVEAVSKLPLDMDCVLKVTLSVANGVAAARNIDFTIAGKPDERYLKYSNDTVKKFAMELDGNRFQKSQELTFVLTSAGFDFDCEQVRIIPAAEAKDFLCTPFGFVDSEGKRLLLVLHPPALSEIREWELPRKVSDNLRFNRKTLVIGEDHGAELACDEKITYLNEPYTLRRSLPMLLAEIGKNNCGRAILTLPCREHLAGMENWEIVRYVSALIEKLRANPAIRQIELRPGGDKELQSLLAPLGRTYDIDVAVEP